MNLRDFLWTALGLSESARAVRARGALRARRPHKVTNGQKVLRTTLAQSRLNPQLHVTCVDLAEHKSSLNSLTEALVFLVLGIGLENHLSETEKSKKIDFDNPN